MPAKRKTLDDLFFHTLKDIYYAERKILKNLPRMAKATESGELRQAFETHREETQGQIERRRDLLVRPALDVAQHDARAILRTEPGDRRLQRVRARRPAQLLRATKRRQPPANQQLIPPRPVLLE